MQLGRFLNRSIAAAVLALALAPWVVAQQYQILRADYGYGSQRVDVTQRLRELARTNNSFRMGNSTFGIDPAPGYVKTLRIYSRAPNGQSRTFEYREGSTVNGAMFSGWSGGSWGPPVGGVPPSGGYPGQLNVITGMYGAPGRNRDVAGRLRSMVRNGRLNITVNNSTMGTDPAPGTAKTLWITYSTGGKSATQQITVREGGKLNIP